MPPSNVVIAVFICAVFICAVFRAIVGCVVSLGWFIDAADQCKADMNAANSMKELEDAHRRGKAMMDRAYRAGYPATFCVWRLPSHYKPEGL